MQAPSQPPSTAADLRQLHRMRLYAKAVLGLGVAASLAANVLAANPDLVSPLVSWVVAAWSPLALALTVELITRVPVSDGWLSWLRLLATATIAGIAAWVSYWHMVEVAVAHGEKTIAAHLLPLSVDGLVVVATIVLHELARKVHNIESPAIAKRGSADPSARFDHAAVIGPPTTPTPSPTQTPKAPVKAPTRSASAGATNGPGAATRAAVEVLIRDEPDLTQAEIADRLGISIRTVRRHQSALADPTTDTDDQPTAEEAA